MTDVTGFGLIGHAREMALASNVGLRFYARRVPLLEAPSNAFAQDIFRAVSRQTANLQNAWSYMKAASRTT